ncbi:tetratricopeptide repeat protein [bacterium]|nr:tetratricopeptide repeat protein [candidate division CSSED10-310 bacterium]
MKRDNPQRDVLKYRYTIKRILGFGTNSRVYEAVDCNLNNKFVALKILNKNCPDIFKNYFRDEFRIMARCRHNRLTEVFELGKSETGDTIFYTMELLDRIPFTEVTLRQNRLLCEFLGVCEGVKYLHSLGVVHGRLCPNKLLVSRETRDGVPTVKILDYGSNGILKTHVENDPALPYAPPEVLRNNSSDNQADLYAIGLIFLQAFLEKDLIQDRQTILRWGSIDSQSDEVQSLLPSIPTPILRILIKLIAANPVARYQRIEDVIVALEKTNGFWCGVSRPAIILTSAEGRFINRSKELSRCQSLWQNVVTSEQTGQALIIDGGMGIGKSRFIREFAASLRSDQELVIEAKCIHPEFRFGAFPSVLKTLRFLIPQPNSVIQNLLSMWFERETPEIADEPLPLDSELISSYILEFIIQAAKTKHFVILIKDLHQSDSAGFDLFLRLCEEVKSVPILVVGEIRSSECPVHVRNRIDELASRNILELLRLESLSSEDIQELVRSILGSGAIPRELLTRISRQCNGIPLHAEEMIRLMAQDRSLLRGPEGWVYRPDHGVLTESSIRVKDLIRRRFRDLTPSFMKILRVLAVFSRPATEDVIRELTGDRKDFMEILERLRHMGVLEITPGKGQRSYQFTHNALSDIVIDITPPQQLMEYHNSIGRLLEKQRADLEEIAFHYLRGGLKHHAVKIAYQAAVKCVNTGAIERAEKLFAAASSRLNKTRRRNRNLATWIHYYEAYIAVMRSRVDDAIRNAQKGLEALPGKFPMRLKMKANLTILLAEGYSRKGDYTEALRYLDQAEFLLKSRYPLERMDLHGRRAGVYLFMGKLMEAQREAMRGLALKDKIPKSEEASRKLGNTYNILGYIAKRLGNPDEALAYYKQAWELGEQMRNTHWVAAIHNNMGELYHFTGDVLKAKTHLQKAMEYYRSSGIILSSASPELNLGDVYITLGQNHSARKCYERALDMYRQSNRRRYIIEALEKLILLLLKEWDFQEVTKRLSELAKYVEDIGGSESLVAFMYCQGLYSQTQADLTQAMKSFQRALSFARQINSPHYLSKLHLALGELYLELNAIAWAHRHAQMALRQAEKNNDYRDMITAWIIQGRAYRYFGDPEKATAALSEAEKLLEGKADPLYAFMVDTAKFRLFLETRAKERLKPMIVDLRKRAGEFHNYDLRAELEILATKAYAKLGLQFDAIRVVDRVHHGVLASGYHLLDWQLSRLKARFMMDTGLIASAYREFEMAWNLVDRIGMQITSISVRNRFLKRRDILQMLDLKSQCETLAITQKSIELEPFPESESDERRAIETELSIFSETARTMLTLTDIDKVFRKIAETAKYLVDGENALVMTLGSDRKLWLQSVCSDGSDRNIALREKLASVAGSIAIDSGQLIISRDILQDPRFMGVPDNRRLGTRSMVCIPLLSKNRPVGIIYADSRAIGAQRIANQKTKLIFLADIAAIAIENVRLYDDLDRMFVSVIRSLAAAIDAKDPYTRGHSQRVRDYALAMADEIGLSPEQRRNMELAAFLHDIGKIGIPEGILSHPGPLNPHQHELMKKHPEIGAEILSPINQLERVALIILQHHERYDGLGYPRQVVMDDIVIEARILAIADSLDAITSSRPYRKDRTLEQAMQEIHRNSGSQFDPRYVNVLEKCLQKKSIRI